MKKTSKKTFNRKIVSCVKVFIRIIFFRETINFSKLKFLKHGKITSTSIKIRDNKFYICYVENFDDINLDDNKYNIIISEKKLEHKNFTSKNFKLFFNRDSSLRWIIPSSSHLNSVFNFYRSSFIKNSFLKFIIYVPFFHSFFFKDYYLYCSPNNNKEIDFYNFNAIYAGILGAHQKVVLFKEEENHQFTKLPIGSLSYESLSNELSSFAALSNKPISSFMPSYKKNGDGLSISMISGVKNNKFYFSNLHGDFINEMHATYSCTNESSLLSEARSFFLNTANFHNTKFENLQLEAKTYFRENIIKYDASRAHGDFTPWNVVKSKNRIYAIDWEMSLKSAPLYFDVFHYIIYSSVLVDHYSFDSLMKRIHKVFDKFFPSLPQSALNKYLFLYVYIQSYRFLNAIHSSEDAPVDQAYWMLEIWLDFFKYFSKTPFNQVSDQP